MKKIPIILLLFISLTTYCQETKDKGAENSTVEITAIDSSNTMFLSKAVKGIGNILSAGTVFIGIKVIHKRTTTNQIHKTKDVKFNMDYRILPLFNGKLSIVNKKLFPNLEPFFSVFLNRNTMVSNTQMENAVLSRPYNLGVSFGAGLRLPISKKLLFDIGLRDEIGVVNNRQLHLTEIFSKDSSPLGLTFGLSYKL